MVRKYTTAFFKIAVFIFLCLFVKILSHNVLPKGIDNAVTAGFSIVFTVLFLIGVEDKKRDFLAPMNGVDGMTFTGVIGIVTVVLPVAVEIIIGKMELDYKPDNFDWVQVLLCGCEGIFVAMLAYGYIFHIVKEDFGKVDAAVVCTLIELIYTDIFIYDFLPDFGDLRFDSFDGFLTVDPSSIENRSMIMILNLVLFSAVAFLLTYRYGDVRPIAVFMFMHYAFISLLPMVLTAKLGSRPMVSGMELYTGFSVSVPMAVLIIYLIFTI